MAKRLHVGGARSECRRISFGDARTDSARPGRTGRRHGQRLRFSLFRSGPLHHWRSDERVRRRGNALCRNTVRAGLFQNRVFRGLWAATIAAQLGGFIQMVAISWTMTGLTSSVALVALVQTAANLPIMMFAIVSGTLADMLGRRSVMLAAQSIVLTFSILLTLFAAFGQLTPALLLLLTFLIGCGTALNGPAWQASVGEIVSRTDISSAVSFNIVGNNLARSTGPAVGGAVVAGLGASWAFLLSAFSYLVILGAVWRWRPSPATRLSTGFR